MTELLTFQSGAPRKGNGPPSSATGFPGDLYYDQLGQDWYGPKTPSGEWGEPTPIQGPPGSPGARWQGSYSDTQAYDPDDIVEYGGSVYISLAQQTGANPEEGEWELFASKGDKGNEGPDAYEVAVAEGFSGTRQEWLDSLRGPQGEPGGGVPEGGSVGQVVGKIGAGDYETGWINPASGYDTDGSTPLKYSAFLAEAGGDQQVALQNAVNALFASASYNRHLDLDGAQIRLFSSVTLPASTNFGIRSISGGEIYADPSFSGDYLLDFNSGTNHMLRFVNVTLDGRDVASWIEWDYGNFEFFACRGRNSKKGTPSAPGPGGLHVYGGSSAGLWWYSGWMTCAEASVEPNQRTQIGIHCESGDQKIFSLTASYFRHALVYDAGALMMNNCHIFQGVSGASDTTNHTAGVKITRSSPSSEIGSVYLDKCFIELSNESNPGQTSIGGCTIQQLKTLLSSAEANFAYVVIRDYHSKTSLKIENVSITGSEFQNSGSALAYPTKIVPGASNFDMNAHDKIHMENNGFSGNIQPQANPVTVVHESTSSSSSRPISTSGLLPFSARPNHVLSALTRPSSGTPGGVYVGSVNRFGQAVTINSSSAYIGTTVVTVTANQAGSGGFVAS